jgi:Subtilase family
MEKESLLLLIDTGVRFGKDLSESRFFPGYDYVQGKEIRTPSESEDSAKHGSHIAGIIAQSTNNNFGAVGLAPSAKIMPVRVLDARLHGDYQKVANAIVYAVDHGAHIINLSSSINQHIPDIHSAIKYAYEKNKIVIAASGNDGDKNRTLYPASYPEVVSVGAITTEGLIAPYSNKASIYAPGGSSIGSNIKGFSGCQEILLNSQIDINLLSKLKDSVVQVVPVLSSNPEKTDRLLGCYGTSQSAGFVSGEYATRLSQLTRQGITSAQAVRKVVTKSATPITNDPSSRILNVGGSVALMKLLLTPRTQLPEIDQRQVEQFAGELKQEGNSALSRGQNDQNPRDFKIALNIYNDVEKLAETSSSGEWNNICWFGTLVAGIKEDKNLIKEIIPACNNAVGLVRNDIKSDIYGNAIDSRGLAKALTGDYAGAISDFEAAIDTQRFQSYPMLKKQREGWIQKLRLGLSPFSREELTSCLQDPNQSKYF